MSEVKKVVLAYSGGLDTSIIIPWLKEHYNNCEVIAVCGNVGQKGELEGLEERAKASGASKLYIEDLTDEFVEDYVIPTMQAGADYEGYLLGTSFARPILAKRVVEIARAEGADAVCHGSTGKGNDQVRFELAIMHFAPDLKTITPWWQTAIYALIAVLAVLTILFAWQLSKALKRKKELADTAPAVDQK